MNYLQFVGNHLLSIVVPGISTAVARQGMSPAVVKAGQMIEEVNLSCIQFQSVYVINV